MANRVLPSCVGALVMLLPLLDTRHPIGANAAVPPQLATPALSLGNRVHTFAHPGSKRAMVDFFREVLQAEVTVLSAKPDIVAFAFGDRSSLSVEFTSDALSPVQARRGTWVEIRTGDVAAVEARIRAAGVSTLLVPGSDDFYFQAPGGQVMRLVPGSKALSR